MCSDPPDLSLSLSALSWPFSTAAAGASRTPTASRRHLRTAQAWWCTARMHNSAVSESFTGPNGPLGCHTQRGHAPSSSNLRRGTAWQRALKRADIVAPRSTLILAHAHKRALHAPQCCMVWRGMCWVLHRMVPRATRQNPASWHTAWKRAFRAKSGTQPSTQILAHAHTMRMCTRLAPGALCAGRRAVLTAAPDVRSAIDFAMVTYHPPLNLLRRWPCTPQLHPAQLVAGAQDTVAGGT